MLNLRKVIDQSLGLRFFMDGPNGAVGGEAPVDKAPDLFDQLKIPQELRDDPEMMDEVKEFGDSLDPVPEKEVPVVEKPEDEGKDEKPVVVDPEKKPEEDKADDAFEFESDIAIGDVTFSKDSLGKLPPDVLQNIGSLKTHVDELSGKLNEETQKTQSLLADPVVAYQAKRIAEGTANQPIPSIGVSKETKQALLSSLTSKHGLAEDEATEVFETLRKEIEADIRSNVDVAVKNSLSEFKQTADAKAHKQKSYELLSSVNDMLAQAKPELALKDAKIAEILERGASHPQYATFKNGVGKFFDYWSGLLNSWAKFSQMSPEEIYSPVAAKLGLPVAINTQERDSKIAMTERNKAIAALGGKRIAKAMSQKPAPASTDGGRASFDNQGGIDKSKLDNPEYVENLLASAKSDKELFDIQKQLRQLATAN